MKKRIVIGLVLAAALLGLAVPAALAYGGEPYGPQGQVWEDCPGFYGGGYGIGFLDRATLNKVAELLGLTPTKLLAQLRDGETLAEIAESKGVSVDKVVDTILTGYKEKLAQRVEAGYLTQRQADLLLELAQERVETFVQEGAYGFGWGHMGGMMGGFGPWGGRISRFGW